MPLPNSGIISLNNIQTEFGGLNPISLSEYYGISSGIPSSGILSLSNFYGAGNDNIPDLISFLDINNFETISDTITGISIPITLRISLNSAPFFGVTLNVSKNNTVVNSFISGQSLIYDLNVSNNDTIAFTLVRGPGDPNQYSAICSIINVSDNNTFLDSFVINSLPQGFN